MSLTGRLRFISRFLVFALLIPATSGAAFNTNTKFDPTGTGNFAAGGAVKGIASWDWQDSGSLVIESTLVSASNGSTTLDHFFANAPNGATLSFRIHAQARLNGFTGGLPSPAPGLDTDGAANGDQGYEVTATLDGVETATLSILGSGNRVLVFSGITGTFQYHLDLGPNSHVPLGTGFKDGGATAPFLWGTLSSVDGSFTFNPTTNIGSGNNNITSTVMGYNPLVVEADAAVLASLVGSSFFSNINVTTEIGTTEYLGLGLAEGTLLSVGQAPYTFQRGTVVGGTLRGANGDLVLRGDASSTFTAAAIPLARIGDFVWEDLNANGIQDAGEPGIAGSSVTLYACNGAPVASTATGTGGLYLFEGLAPGDYYLVFGKPTGFQFTGQDQGGDDAKDSDAEPASGGTVCTTLSSGEDDRTWDAGLYRPASLGDRVWEDQNGNGLQDGGEPGVSGVAVDLYACGGELLATTTTNSAGTYLFSNLRPGSYSVTFTPPSGFAFTLKDQGTDDAIDSDADPISGGTACTTLTSGETDLTWDAGLVEIIEEAAIGDFVWDDLNADGIQDSGEPGIGGAAVTLQDCSDKTLAATTTDANGFYLFSGLMPGDYQLVFTAPAGFLSSPRDQGGDDAWDSDPHRTTGVTACTTLVSGETDRTWDAGFYRATPAIDIEKATNGHDADTPTGPYISLGAPVTWTYVVTNTGNVPLTSVTVTDSRGVAVTCPKSALAVGEVMTCTGSGTAALGQYGNLGTATGYYGTTKVEDSDPSHYYGKMDAPGTGTPGYWKNHPEAWPVDQLTIGGVVYSKSTALGLLGCPDGNKLFTVFRALVAAKLNVLMGNEASCIAATITAADAWMAAYGPMPTACNGKPEVKARSAAWRTGEPLYWRLDAYNNGLLCAPSRDAMK